MEERGGVLPLVLVLVVGAVLAWYLLSGDPVVATPTTTKGLTPPRSSCGSVGSAYGVPLCTSAVTPFLKDIVSVIPGVVDRGLDIGDCPYATKMAGPVKTPANAEELNRCIAWAKANQMKAQQVIDQFVSPGGLFNTQK